MKQFICTASFICFSLVLYAQSDSSKTNPALKNQNQHAIPQEERSYPTKDMVRVSPKDISNGLKRRLVGAQYAGWEKGTVYYDKKTKEYALLMPPGSTRADSLKNNAEINAKKGPHVGWHYFTYDGAPISN